MRHHLILHVVVEWEFDTAELINIIELGDMAEADGNILKTESQEVIFAYKSGEKED